MFPMKIDQTSLRRAEEALDRSSRPIAVRVLGGVATRAGQLFRQVSPADTNRYVAGWVRAALGAGATGLAVPALKESKGRRRNQLWLERQRDKAQEAVEAAEALIRAWYPPGRPRKGYFRRLQARLDKAHKRLQRAEQELRSFEQNESAIVIGGARRRDGSRGLATVRQRVFGGQGSIVRVGDQHVLIMRNLEPHAKLVERRSNTAATVRKLLAPSLQSGATLAARQLAKAAAAAAGPDAAG